ncbi:hypothetical protein B0H67DRAFT_572823 [Lasiosphaeris hirsuta]|uniref:Uncharacterized protein n=1 Tax=Lasiosphaeris hirsuta TaxID=260670 RepID=A0AA40E1J9_9PEZI|nr:hypothetical protein B0H67DRAFT_572823 [Lasiosphaeris hirsuta]
MVSRAPATLPRATSVQSRAVRMTLTMARATRAPHSSRTPRRITTPVHIYRARAY